MDDLACFEADEVADDESDEEFEADIWAITRQWHRSTQIVNHAYRMRTGSMQTLGSVWEGLTTTEPKTVSHTLPS